MMGPTRPSSAASTPSTLAEINVTPLVDVMLVLLIIFMVCAPLMHKGLEVNLPTAKGEGLAQKEDHVVIKITAAEALFWNESPISWESLDGRLRSESEANPGLKLYLEADQTVPYGKVAELIAGAREAGVTQLGLVTREPKRPR